ncbi:MAG: hypothetical protein ACR2FO_01095 [Actinomycetota bacterium]
MATYRQGIEREQLRRPLLPPPVEGGTGHFSSRGRFIDALMGNAKMRRQALGSVEELRVKANAEAEDDSGDEPAEIQEPPATDLPPPVESGTGTETKGDRLGGPATG